MKVFARKQYQVLPLNLASTERKGEMPESDLNAGSLKDSFSGWLDLVSLPMRVPVTQPKRLRPRVTILSGLDFMRVSNATVREGESHCIWPFDVLVKFQSAEVVTKSSAKHYVITDPNISPVKRK